MTESFLLCSLPSSSSDTYLKEEYSRKAEKSSPRQLRQLDYISQFTTDIVHVKGENNVVADTLSRINAIEMPSTLSAEIIANAQEAHPELADIVRSTSLELNHLRIEEEDIWCDVSMGIVRLYLPQPLRRKAFDVIHGPAHPSARSTLKCIKQKFIWPGINQDVSRWARECLPCQRSKVSRHNKPRPEYIEATDNRFNHIHLDLIELPPVRGNRYCLTIIDRFSRWPVALPLPNIEADTVTSALFNHWICNFGTPLTITADQGMQFESALFQSLARLIGATRIRTMPYHPQANGLIERWHSTLKAALRCHAPTPWLDILPTVLLGLRACVKEDLQASPAELLFGTTLRLPGEFFVHEDPPADPFIFLEKFREYIHRVFLVDINGEEKTLSTELLKPAFIVLENNGSEQPQTSDPRPSTSSAPQFKMKCEPHPSIIVTTALAETF
ncbi:uncharacterized protein LOC112588598 [Harpegnathos saltator]|uniref:uncharacterized protein LOC112588598 n=1 Tax=Harpegnathos saltator TaxID=610380 RepID=UPI000DBED0F6|nr:uncharacterized protein LOC112588598 [Harpegnathos saltator]